jgi:hypothetical protein
MRIPDEARKCVAFVYCQRNKTKEPRGTAFLVGHNLAEGRDGDYAVYFVTARHVVENIRRDARDSLCHLRMNTKQGGIENIAIPVSDWVFHEDSRIDVAVAPIEVDFSNFDHLLVGSSCFLWPEGITSLGIGPGDELFFPGLFVRHPGEKSNIPIVRSGTIAALSNEPIKTKLGMTPACLVEARSIGGLSGSPVFICKGSDYNKYWTSEIAVPNTNRTIFLLGLIQGHYGCEDVLDSAEPDDILLQSDNQIKSVNMGIGVVVPAQHITETLNQPQFIEQRRLTLAEIESRQQSNLPIEDSSEPVG